MQDVWAKVLAGEVIDPGSYSMKTLSVLRNMSAKDAELFERIAPFVISREYIIHYDDINKKYGVSYEDILTLDDLGLLNSSGIISTKIEVKNKPEALMYFEEYILLATSEESIIVEFQNFPLSRAGKELLEVVKQANHVHGNEYKSMPESYMDDVVQRLKNSNMNVKMSLHRIISKKGDYIEYDDHEREIETVEYNEVL